VTLFTTSPGKVADAKRLGASETVVSTGAKAAGRRAIDKAFERVVN
jgi:D-arabinose 1-dehydrogenase-like Zn-dependent alcohol dehydrogenase